MSEMLCSSVSRESISISVFHCTENGLQPHMPLFTESTWYLCKTSQGSAGAEAGSAVIIDVRNKMIGLYCLPYYSLL